MAYTPIPSINEDDKWSPANGNAYLGDNFNFISSTRNVLLGMGGAVCPVSDASAALEQVESSAAAPKPNTLQARYDADTAEYLQWNIVVPPDYGGKPVIHVLYYMASATSGNVVWGACVAALSDEDASVTSKAFGTANTVTSAVPGAAGTLKKASITLADADNMAAEDDLTVVLYRKASDASDTATGDAVLRKVWLSYAFTT